jgi:WD40 repeat protein/energy-coupling factor transporter ATP-binding protein EcfA2
MPPLIGRAAELAWLEAAWDRARRGPGAVVLLTGPRGSGKTRLAAELARSARAGAASVCYVSCLGDPESTRESVAAIARDSGPVLAVIEDIDAAPDDVVRAVGTRAREHPLLVVGTVRGEDAPVLRGGLEHRRLGPLDADAAREIVGLYAGGRAADAPVARLLQATGGLPGPLHELAAEWARADAGRRVQAQVAQAASDRTRLQEVETSLAEEVLQIQLVRERARLYFPELGAVRSRGRAPFMGLASFDRGDADLFFGRERLVAELVAALAGAQFLALVGPSGSGKSSVLRAGLLPALAGGVLPGSEHWRQVVLRPGPDPSTALRRLQALAPADRERTLVAVDQLEELFVAEETDARASFANALAEKARAGALIVIALRADLYGRLAEYPALAQLVAAHHVLVGPMQPDELRRAIELPAARAGVDVERELADALVRDVSDAPGALPLLSTALLELWEGRAGGPLTLAAYDASGGVRGAVSRLAEAAYAALDPPLRDTCRALLVRLATEEPGVGLVRRRAPLQELDLEHRPETRSVLEALAERRLLTTGEHGVEVAHEALLREWPRLRAWLDDDAKGRAVRQHLAQAAGEWQRRGRNPDELYRGARLANALEWTRAHVPELTEGEREFMEASRDAAESATRRVRRVNRRLRILLAGTALLLALAVAGGLLVLAEREQARTAETTALAQRLGAEALVEDSLDRSLLLARQGVALDDSAETRSSLLGALLKNPAAVRVMPGTGQRLLRIAVDRRGTTLAVSDNTDTILLIDPRTYRRRGDPVRLESQPWLIALSPDGSTLAATRVLPDGEELVLVDLPERTVRARRRLREKVFGGIAFSPDGRTLATTELPFADGAPNRLVLLDARSARPTGADAPFPTGHGTVAWAGGDRLLVSWADMGHGDLRGTSEVLDAGTLQPIRRLGRGWEWVAVAPNGRAAALPAGVEGAVAVLDLRSGAVRKLRGRHASWVTGAAFNEAGTLVTAADDGSLIVWDTASGEPSETLEGHAGRAWGPVFTPDGGTFFTAALDGAIIAWDLRGDRRLGRRFALQGENLAGNEALGELRPTVSPDGESFAIAAPDGTVSIWDAGRLSQRRSPLRPARGPLDARYLPDGTLAFLANGTLGFLDPATGAVRTRVRLSAPEGAPPGVLAVQPGGARLAVATAGTIRVFDGVTRREVTRPLPLDGATGLALSPDGGQLAAALEDGRVEFWDLRRRARIAATEESAPIGRALAYSPDGAFVATGSEEGYLRIWDAATARLRDKPVLAHAGSVLDVGFSRDGRLLFTAGSDGVVSLWDAASVRQLGSPLPVAPGAVAASFTPDGRQLVAVADSRRGVVWSVDPEAWKRHACAVAGRVLTRDEWSRLLPDRPYRPACR